MQQRTKPSGEMIIAVGALLLAAMSFWQAKAIPVSQYATVGPAAFPYIIATALTVAGMLLLLAALKGSWQTDEEREAKPNRTAMGWMLAGVTLNTILIGPLGFTIASIVLFVCVARAFQSDRPLRDAGIAAAFSLITYIGFARALGINIGAGLVENGLDQIIAKVWGA
jgi:Tripartite tricarboxylate transporter TctB family